MFYKAKVAVCSEIHTEHINTVCGQKVEFCSVKPSDTQTLRFKRLIVSGVPAGEVGLGTELQVGDLPFRFTMGSIGFLIDLIVAAALFSWGRTPL